LYELATPVLLTASIAIKTANTRDLERKKHTHMNDSDEDDDLKAHAQSDSDEEPIQSAIV
jgi:hypothetical protein